MSDQIDPNAQITPYGVTMTQADQVNPADPSNKTVCIIDSGYFLGHEDLPTANVTGTSESPDSPWNQDGIGHGSHVAGIVAAVNNDRGVVGADPGVNLHIVRIFDNDGNFFASSLINALGSCETAGANVVNMSFGGSDPSVLEQDAFANAYQAGILPVAAAGNDGDTTTSYPAGYDSVISVAAVDSDSNHADFSQMNSDVELAAPGVDVLSTYPTRLPIATLTAGANNWSGHTFDQSPSSDGVTGTLADGGLCDSITAGEFTGQVVLCLRGAISFAEKIRNVEGGGGVAAVIYNSVPGDFGGSAYDGLDPVTIPAISLSQAAGQEALLSIGSDATVVSKYSDPQPNGYQHLNGTSMAAPYVSGIAAKIWSSKPNATASAVRAALDSSALDLGSPGRDDLYGEGLVQAQAALLSLAAAPPPVTVSTTSLPAARVAVAYSKALAATPGVAPYSWVKQSGTLPPGVSVSAGGVISGTPTVAGTYNFVVQVTDSASPADTATKALSITVAPGFGIVTSSLPSGRVGVGYVEGARRGGWDTALQVEEAHQAAQGPQARGEDRRALRDPQDGRDLHHQGAGHRQGQAQARRDEDVHDHRQIAGGHAGTAPPPRMGVGAVPRSAATTATKCA